MRGYSGISQSKAIKYLESIKNHEYFIIVYQPDGMKGIPVTYREEHYIVKTAEEMLNVLKGQDLYNIYFINAASEEYLTTRRGYQDIIDAQREQDMEYQEYRRLKAKFENE